MSEFSGFSVEAFDFLRELGVQTKPWFETNRATYDTEVVAPTKAFVVAVGGRLAAGIAPDIVALPKANGSIAPINKDLRFSPDKSPYKDHLFLRFWEGANKKSAPTLFLRISPDDVGFATGVQLPDLERWRSLIDDDATGVAFQESLDSLTRVVKSKGFSLDLAGEGYKRVPKGYAADHPRADLLRHKGFQARWMEPLPKTVHKAAFAEWCVSRLDRCADLHRWMVAHLT